MIDSLWTSVRSACAGSSELKSKQGYRTEFHYGEMLRVPPRPAGAEEPAVTATYKAGILEVRVPLHEEHKAAITHVAVAGAWARPDRATPQSIESSSH